MNPEILTFLVRGRKVGMPDRTERGLSPHPPIMLSEVEQHGWHDHKQGQAIHEGGVIERKGRSEYIYRRDLDGWRVIG